MNEKLLNLGLVLVNWIIERSKTNPVVAAKIKAGEPLTVDDFKNLGDDRDAAGEALDAALE